MNDNGNRGKWTTPRRVWIGLKKSANVAVFRYKRIKMNQLVKVTSTNEVKHQLENIIVTN